MPHRPLDARPGSLELPSLIRRTARPRPLLPARIRQGAVRRTGLRATGDRSVLGQESRAVAPRDLRMPGAPQDPEGPSPGYADLALRPMEGSAGRDRGLPAAAPGSRLRPG